MALSGVNQSHVQPVWAEIPSRSADIGARAVIRIVTLGEYVSKLLCRINMGSYARALEEGEGDRRNLSALPAQNLLADPVNSRVPYPDIQLEMGIFCSAACIVNGFRSI
ncbi:uncharacterized protein LOC144325096 [Podarcis muralis]